MLLSTAAVLFLLTPAPWNVVTLAVLGALGLAEHIAWFALGRRARV